MTEFLLGLFLWANYRGYSGDSRKNKKSGNHYRRFLTLSSSSSYKKTTTDRPNILPLEWNIRQTVNDLDSGQVFFNLFFTFVYLQNR